MSNTATIKVALKIDDQGVVRGFRDISTAAENTGTKGAKAFNSMGSSVKATTAMLKQMSVVAAGLSVGIGFAVKQSIDAVAEIDRLSTMAGVSTEAFQELSFAAGQYQINQDALTDGMKELSLRGDEFVKTGAGPAKESFERLGYSVDDLNKRLDDSPALLSDIISRMEGLDKAAQLRIADELFGGEGGEQFVAMIQGGANALDTLRKSARDLGVVIDSDMVKQSVEAKKQIGQLTTIVSAQFNSAVADLAPNIVDVAQKTTEWMRANKDLIGQKTAEYITDIKDAASKVYTVIAEIKGLYDGLPDSVKGDVGIGLVGAILFGPKAGLALGVASDYLDRAAETREALEGMKAGVITADDLSSGQDVFQAALERYRTYKDSLAAIDKKYPINAKTPGYDNYLSSIPGKPSSGRSESPLANKEAAEKLASQQAAAWQSAYSSMDTITQAVYDKMLEYAHQEYEENIKLLGDKETAQALYAQRIKELNKKLTGSDADENIKAINRQIAALQLQADTLGKTASEAELYKLEIQGAKPEQLALAESLYKTIDAFEASAEAKEKAAQKEKQAQEKKTNALAEFSDSYKHATMTSTAYELDQLQQRYNYYDKYVKDKAALDEWYKAEQKNILDQTDYDWDNAFSGWANSYSSTLNDMLWGSESTFSDIAISFGKMITEMIIQQELIKPFVSSMTESGGWISQGVSAISGLFASEHGNVFQANNAGISAYSNKVISSPIVFPFAKGIGLMGEAGAEAILPLTRTSSGNLGVEAAGMGGSSSSNISVELNITNKSNQNVAAKQDSIKWDAASKKMILGVILEAAENNTGNFRTTMKRVVQS